ncbi:hypothetical protein GGF31_001367 [Allomyces arbusculus]|nr:hypothetical protein GGF31_001367 [Allomyces arbusculus]
MNTTTTTRCNATTEIDQDTRQHDDAGAAGANPVQGPPKDLPAEGSEDSNLHDAPRPVHPFLTQTELAPVYAHLQRVGRILDTLPVDGDAIGPAGMLAGRDPPSDLSMTAQDAHWPNVGGIYAPHTAAILGKWMWFQYLVAQGVTPRTSPASTPMLLWRPLGVPAKSPWTEVIDRVDENGWTLLMYAVLADCVEARDWPVGEGSEPAPLRYIKFFYETRPVQFRAQAAYAAPRTPLWVAVALDSIPVLTAIAVHPILPSVLAALPRDAARRDHLVRHLFRTARSLAALRLLSKSLFPDPRTRCTDLFKADTLGPPPWLSVLTANEDAMPDLWTYWLDRVVDRNGITLRERLRPTLADPARAAVVREVRAMVDADAHVDPRHAYEVVVELLSECCAVMAEDDVVGEEDAMDVDAHDDDGPQLMDVDLDASDAAYRVMDDDDDFATRAPRAAPSAKRTTTPFAPTAPAAPGPPTPPTAAARPLPPAATPAPPLPPPAAAPLPPPRSATAPLPPPPTSAATTAATASDSVTCPFPECTYTAPQDRAFAHYKKVHGEPAAHTGENGQFTCPFPGCSRMLTTHLAYWRHFNWHFPLTRTCPTCHARCRTAQTLATHIKEKH